MNNTAISIQHLFKYYPIPEAGQRGRLSKFIHSKKTGQVCALHDIDLNIGCGEMVGIIGPNGSGKSTLLKVISELTPPSQGTIEVNGNIASILEVGIGFKPELSGRENIFLSAGMYGLNKSKAQSIFESVLAFFGFREFIDTPVKYYSSGMYMRLAFSLVVHLEADIYLFDEVLSVGDSTFKKLVIQRLTDLKKSGKTILFVSHNPNEFINICDTLIMLNAGKISACGKPDEVLLEEHRLLGNSTAQNMHCYIEKEQNRKQVLNADVAADLSPVSAKLIVNDGIVSIEFRYLVQQANINIQNYLIIKDKDTRPLAQISFTEKQDQSDITVTENVKIPIDCFGPYLFFFDFLTIVNGQAAILLPQALCHTFPKQPFTLGLLNLDYLKR